MISGFVYLWYDAKQKKFCLGSHMGQLDDGYISSTGYFKRAYRKRPHDMRRRILETIDVVDYPLLRQIEQRWLKMIKEHELGVKYYNKINYAVGYDAESSRKVQLKRIAEGRHHLSGGELQRKLVQEGKHPALKGGAIHKATVERVNNGTHHLLGNKFERTGPKKFWSGMTPEERSEHSSNRAKLMVEKGTHNFLDGTISRRMNLRRVEEGTHKFLDREWQSGLQKKRVEEGTHHLLSGKCQKEYAIRAIKDGTHVIIQQLTCPHCSKTGNKPNMLRWHFDRCKSKKD